MNTITRTFRLSTLSQATNMIQRFYNGEEHTTRHRLQEKYNIPSTNLHLLLTKYQDNIVKVADGNKSYLLKIQAESIIENHYQKLSKKLENKTEAVR
jgi:nitrogenase subunit NifH